MIKISWPLTVLISSALLVVLGWMALDVVPGVTPAAAEPAGPQPLGAVSGGCAMNRVKFRTSDVHTSTSSTSMVDLSSTAVSFTVGGSSPTCLKVEFSAAVELTGNNRLDIFVVLDGVTPGLPTNGYALYFTGDTDENSNGGWPRATAFNFAFQNVSPGSHTVKIRWGVTGGTAHVWHRSIFVHYFQ